MTSLLVVLLQGLRAAEAAILARVQAEPDSRIVGIEARLARLETTERE